MFRILVGLIFGILYSNLSADRQVTWDIAIIDAQFAGCSNKNKKRFFRSCGTMF